MSPNPHEIKMCLEAQLQKLQATIVDIHSVCVEDGVVHVGFDVTDASGDWTLFFAFERPDPKLVSRSDLNLFARWLAAPSHVGMTMH